MIEQEGFKVIPGYQLARSFRFIPERPGVYGLLIRHGDKVLKAAGYEESGQLAAWSIGEYAHLYSGCSGNLRDRIKKHFAGDDRVSSFRKSLLALHERYGAIDATGYSLPIAPNEEFALTLWLCTHAAVAFRRCSDPVAAELDLISRAPSPLNIKGKADAPFCKILLSARAATMTIES